MRRTLLFIVVAAGALAGAAPAHGVVIIPPVASGGEVVANGSASADAVSVRRANGRTRIVDAQGVVVEPVTAGTPACTQQSFTEARCSGDVVVRLQGGDDRIAAGLAPATSIDGGAGDDTVTYADSTRSGLVVDLAQGGTDAGARLHGLEIVEGSATDDELIGGPGPEVLRGGGGGDRLAGGAGGDLLEGGDGDDTISAMTDGGGDAVRCGAGVDVASLDVGDTADATCETLTGPGLLPVAPSPQTPLAPPTTQPAVVRGAAATILSGPAADSRTTRIGARILARGGALVRLIVRDGDRVVGQAETRTRPGVEAHLSVPLDQAVRDAVARSRRAQLTALVETVHGHAAPLVDERQVTLMEPPPFVRGPVGVTRNGGFGPERLSGTARSDLLSGASGNDVLSGMAGNDRLDGGTGNDRLAGSAGNDRLDGYDGDDRLLGGEGDDLLIESRFGDDTLDGGPGADWIDGARGIDTIRGGEGDDVIFGGSAPDRIDCGPGNDTAFVNLASERARLRDCETVLEEDDVPSVRCSAGEGSENGETMLGSEAPDVCRGHGGDDDVEGAGGHDRLFAGTGSDRVFGRFGNDRLVGEDGDDELEGGRGSDRLWGGAGNDQLNGGYDSDRLYAGPGSDVLIARGGGADRLDCGPGRDVVIADRRDRVTGCEIVRRG